MDLNSDSQQPVQMRVQYEPGPAGSDYRRGPDSLLPVTNLAFAARFGLRHVFRL